MEYKVSSQSPFEKSIGFSRAKRIGNWISVSGTAPLNDEGKTHCHNNLYEQTKRCLEISLAAIESAGGKPSGIIRTRLMLTDIKRWEEAAKAHGEVFSEIRPACTFVEVKGFINPEWLIETEMDCVISDE